VGDTASGLSVGKERVRLEKTTEKKRKRAFSRGGDEKKYTGITAKEEISRSGGEAARFQKAPSNGFKRGKGC